MELSFDVLILGSDFNAYYMARCYHEIYHKKVDIIAKKAIGVVSYSKIVNFKEVENFENAEIFVTTLNNYAKEKKVEKILLIGTSDELVRLIIENKEKLSSKYVHNYPSLEILNHLLVKDVFYQTFENSELDIPKTYNYPCGVKEPIDEEKIRQLQYPLIVKPGNNIEYHKHKFEGMYKVFKVFSREELQKVIDKIEESGYHNNLVIQEFIPGDDSALHDCLFYCGKDKKARVATFAQIGLQEHTPTGIGNCTVLVNGFSQYGYPEDLIYQLKDFLESIGYQGFAEFDLKYDVRDQKFKVFEINPRQSRSGYYLSACGYNLVDLLVKDLYTNELNFDFEIAKEKMVLSFVPKRVMKQYILSKPLKEEIKRLIKQKKLIHPIAYSKDMSLKRRKYLFMRALNYQKKYQKYHF